jgi:hypothetical protein
MALACPMCLEGVTAKTWPTHLVFRHPHVRLGSEQPISVKPTPRPVDPTPYLFEGAGDKKPKNSYD